MLCLNPDFNIEMNERVAFMLANNRPIKRNCGKVARALLSRDAHTAAFDGRNIYYFIDDMDVFV